MRYVSLALFLVTAALCFVAGYKLGKESQPPAPIVSETNTVMEAPIAQLTDTSDPVQLALEPPEVEPAPDSWARRAEETVQTFFDKDQRPLVAEILEVRADSLKIRRQSDGQELELPIVMLSPEDQAFAAYLWEQQTKGGTPPASKSGRSMEDTFWDELFK